MDFDCRLPYALSPSPCFPNSGYPDPAGWKIGRPQGSFVSPTGRLLEREQELCSGNGRHESPEIKGLGWWSEGSPRGIFPSLRCALSVRGDMFLWASEQVCRFALGVITCLKGAAGCACASELRGAGQVFQHQACVHWAQTPALEQVHGRGRCTDPNVSPHT